MPLMPKATRPPWLSERKAWQHARRWEGYNTKRWKKSRAAFLLSVSYQCAVDGCANPASEVDHIDPISSGCDPWNQDNWQALCPAHHKTKTIEERTARRRGEAGQGGGAV